MKLQYRHILLIHHPEILLRRLILKYLGLDVLALLPDERLVDVGDDAAPAMVALIRVSNSSSPRIASCDKR